MSKIITSPSKRWPGSVTLAEPLTLPQMAAYHEAMINAPSAGENQSWMMYFNAIMPGLYKCIEEFNLDDWDAFSPQQFPGQPMEDAVELATWLLSEIQTIALEEDKELPKASTDTPLPTQLEQEKAKS